MGLPENRKQLVWFDSTQRMARFQMQPTGVVMVLEMRQELIANCLLAVFCLSSPRPDENHRTLRTETAKMTFLLNPSQGRLGHRVSQNDRFQIHDEFKKGARGRPSVLPLS